MTDPGEISRLDNLLLAYPCPIDWDSMTLTEDERKRYCSKCAQNVYDVSALTKAEAEAFLKDNESTCIKFYLRTDGTIVTKGCRAYFKPKYLTACFSKFKSIATSAIFSVLTFLGAIPAVLAEANQQVKFKETPQLGWPAPDEAKQTFEELTSRLELNIEAKPTIQVIKSHYLATRSVDMTLLKKLKSICKRNDDYVGFYYSALLEKLLRREIPSKQRDSYHGEDLSKLQAKTIARLLDEAKSKINQKDYKHAFLLIQRAQLVADTGLSLPLPDSKEPKKWTNIAACSWQSNFRMNSESLDKSIELLKSIPDPDKAAKTLLSRQELAKANTLLLQNPNDLVLKKRFKELITSWSIAERQRAPLIVIAEYRGYDRGSGEISYFHPPKAKYKILSVLKGTMAESNLPLRYDFQHTINQPKPENWIFDQKTMMPKTGSKWILFLIPEPINGMYETVLGADGRESYNAKSKARIVRDFDFPKGDPEKKLPKPN